MFSHRDGFVDMPVDVPCGQCIGCRLERSRQWAIRCMHEASLYEENCFITLTYADEHLPPGGTLEKAAFQKFMKRLRKQYADRRIRFFHAGEYGSRFGRPHYHACVFNFDFPDKLLWTRRREFPVWRSESLERLWPFGNSEIGTVTFESAAYVARYITKKVTGKDAAEHYLSVDEGTGEVFQRLPEYTTMSRRPGIGAPWLEKFGFEVYPSDGVVVRGRLMKPPKFYDLQFEMQNPEEAARVIRRRQLQVDPGEQTWDRLRAREACAVAKVNLCERSVS